MWAGDGRAGDAGIGGGGGKSRELGGERDADLTEAATAATEIEVLSFAMVVAAVAAAVVVLGVAAAAAARFLGGTGGHNRDDDDSDDNVDHEETGRLSIKLASSWLLEYPRAVGGDGVVGDVVFGDFVFGAVAEWKLVSKGARGG